MKKIIVMLSLFVLANSSVYAQKNIRESDQMYKRTVVRALDLRERQNKPLFSRNREITSFFWATMSKNSRMPERGRSRTWSAMCFLEVMKRMAERRKRNEPGDARKSCRTPLS